MGKEELKRYAKFTLKLLLTGAALYFVFTKIDISGFVKTLKSVNALYYALAVVSFNVSITIASFRVNHFYEQAGSRLHWFTNLKLYYVGMFYNMFLPGSIGGDVYKVYLLRQNRENVRTRHLVSATFLNRVSGMAFLFLFTCIFVMFSSFNAKIPYLNYIIIGLMVAVLPLYYLFLRIGFSRFVPKYWITNFYSLCVQAGQVMSALFIIASLNEMAHLMDYLSLFMVSTVVAIVPFTIGGAGARELVFYYGFEYLSIQQEAAVAFAVLFFGVTAITAFIGFFFVYFIDRDLLQQRKLESQSS